MYKPKYPPIEGLPLTVTIPLLLEWVGLSPDKIQAETDDVIRQENLHRICSGQTQGPGPKVLGPIAEYFGVTIPQIWDVDYIREKVKQPAPAGVTYRLKSKGRKGSSREGRISTAIVVPTVVKHALTLLEAAAFSGTLTEADQQVLVAIASRYATQDD